MELAGDSELRRVQLGHRARYRAPDVVGDVDVDVVQLQHDLCLAGGRLPVEVGRDQDQRRHPLVAQRRFGRPAVHDRDQVRFLVGLDQAAEAQRKQLANRRPK